MENERWGETTMYIVATVFGVLLLSGYLMRHTLSAVLTSLVFAFILNPLLNILEKRGCNRLTSIIILYALCSAFLLSLSLLLIPYIGRQLEFLTHELPRYAQNVKTALQRWRINLAPYYSGEEGEWLIARALDLLSTFSEKVSGLGLERVKGALYGIFNLVLAPILVFFMLLYKDFFKTTLTRLMPVSERDFFTGIGGKINHSLERFMIAMLLDCLLVGLLCGGALWLLGIQFPLLNGLLAGTASIVPILGGVVAVIPPAFLGYAQSGDLTIIAKVCASYFLIYVIIEGNLIKPLIMKTTMKLNPLAVIFALMAMGEILGFWGVVLALPLAAVVKLCIGEIHRLYLEEK
ncbi:MAG TPA: AI-2E family transporter [Geobacteraceae bacterium]|nr:AI-2E family transporter [Geobacteraceae bacterium]